MIVLMLYLLLCTFTITSGCPDNTYQYACTTYCSHSAVREDFGGGTSGRAGDYIQTK